jgi:hypothetical protein
MLGIIVTTILDLITLTPAAIGIALIYGMES